MASEAPRPGLPEAVIAQLNKGSPALAVLEGWRLMDAAVRNPESLGQALAEAARLDLSKAFAGVAPAAAFGFAVVGGDRGPAAIDDRFLTWFGAPTDHPGLRRLVQVARKRGLSSGLVDGLDGQAIATCAAPAQSAGAWPLPAAVRAAATPGRVVVMGFAPSRGTGLAQTAARCLGLTPMEARLAEALLDSPTLRVAAARIGVGYETAREAMVKIRKRTGATSAADVVRRLMSVMCGELAVDEDLAPMIRKALGATPAEARVGALVAEGHAAQEIARRLGVRETTVRGQLKSLYAKAGVGRGRDLLRITTEASALAAVTQAAETVTEQPSPVGGLRVVAHDNGRRVAFWDHGPRGGRPLLVPHGAITGRTLPVSLTLALQQHGWRPIIPQRPGFGLTDPATGDYLETAADDVALILDRLRIARVRILARDEGVAATLAFASRHPDRVSDGMLVKPRLDGRSVRLANSPAGAIKRAMLLRPELIGAAAEMLRRQTRTDVALALLQRTLADVPSDIDVLAREAEAIALVRDIQAMVARTSQGFADEQRAYAGGWTPPDTVGGSRWLVVDCGAIALPGTQQVYAHLPGVAFGHLPDAGFLAFWSHGEILAAMVDSLTPLQARAAA